MQGQRSAITRLNGLFGQAAKTLSIAMSPAKTNETAQPSSSSSSSSSSSNREIEDDDDDEDEDDQDVSFLFPIRPQAGGPTVPNHRTLPAAGNGTVDLLVGVSFVFVM